MHLFCLIQEHTLKNTTTNNHTTLPEPWPFQKCVVYCSSACDNCLLLYTFKWSLCHFQSVLGIHKVPPLGWDVTSTHAHFTLPEEIQSLSWQGLRDSLPSSKHCTVSRNFLTAWDNSCCYCAPQSFILPSTWYFHPSLPPTSKLRKREEGGRRQFPLVLFSSCCYTQYHKLGSLTQHRCIILQLWSSQSETSFTRLMSTGQQDGFPLWKPQEKNLFSYLFQLLVASYIPWLGATSSFPIYTAPIPVPIIISHPLLTVIKSASTSFLNDTSNYL